MIEFVADSSLLQNLVVEDHLSLNPKAIGLTLMDGRNATRQTFKISLSESCRPGGSGTLSENFSSLSLL